MAPPGAHKGVTPSGVVLEYPLAYTFKIMGLSSDDFPEHARRIVARVVGDAPAERVTVRSSSGGKYQSVSVDVLLRSEEERRAVYQMLHADARVVYYL
jgi:putative lipoic acid-binding regulatory protein